MIFTLEQLDYCRSLAGEALAAAPLDERDELAALTQLRKACPPEMASAIWALRTLRRRAAESGKLPAAFAERLLADERMIQQASSMRTAMYVGRRLARLAAETPGEAVIYDLCCGMGVNAIGAALAARAAGLPSVRIRGFDLSPQAVFCARHNAAVMGVGELCEFAVADATGLDIPESAIAMIDPDRRAEGRRSVLPADHSPGEDFLRKLPLLCAGGAIKLSPACSAAALADWQLDWVYLGESGRCRQLAGFWPSDEHRVGAAVLYGEQGEPRAFELTVDRVARPALAEQVEPGAAIILPHRAVSAAGAVGALAARLVEAGWASVAMLSRDADILCAGRVEHSPMPEGFEQAATVMTLVEPAPARIGQLASRLARLGAGQVEVLTRGLSAGTDAIQKKLGGDGPEPLSVILYADGKSRRALVCRRNP